MLDLNKLDLSKKVVLDLAKKNNIEGHQAQVVVVLDYSGSMDALYRQGVVQQIVERLVPIAMAFDDNAEMECFKFHSNVEELKPITLKNLDGYVNRYVNDGRFGGTNYAPAIEAIVKQHLERSGVTTAGQQQEEKKGFFSKLFKKTEVSSENASTSPLPTYVIFITDGENFDTEATEREIKKASNHGVFFQFVGISNNGNSRFPQLEKLDDLSGRLIDNANFFQIKTVDLAGNQSDSDLYGKLLHEYPSWIKLAKQNNLIK